MPIASVVRKLHPIAAIVESASRMLDTNYRMYPTYDQSRNNFPISVALFDPKPQAMVF